MRFVHFYLIAYFALLIGASVALWKAGVLARIDGTLIAVVFVVAVGLGIALGVMSTRQVA